MAAELLDLPNEILTIIFGYIDTPWSACQTTPTIPTLTRPNLCALALTCRRISALSRNLIFRSITLEYSPPHHQNVQADTTNPRPKNRIKLLLRSWHADPTLYLDYVYQVNWYKYMMEDDTRDEFFDCIAQSQSLHELNMLHCFAADVRRLVARLHCHRHHYDRIPESASHRPYCFPSLGVLRIRPSSNFFNYTDLFLKLCSAPYLQHLETGAYGISTTITPKDVEVALSLSNHSNSPSSSNASRGLESLHISQKSFIDVSDLGLILQVCNKRLKRLQIPPPAPGIKYDDGRRDRFPATNQRISPGAIATALQPVAHSLEALSITDPDVIFYAAPDATRLNLSTFSALRTLKISSFVLAGGHHLSLSHRVAGERQNTIVVPPPPLKIWEILPPNLEELYVAFDALEGVFYNMESLDFSAEDPFDVAFAGLWDRGPGAPVMVERALAWVAELVEEKEKEKRSGLQMQNGGDAQRQILPGLRRVDLVECHNTELLLLQQTGRHVEIALKSLSLRAHHPDVFRKFDEAGSIRVDVRIYVPSEWPSL